MMSETERDAWLSRRRAIRARVERELRKELHLIGRIVSVKRINSVMDRLQDKKRKNDQEHYFGFDGVKAEDIRREVSALVGRLYRKRSVTVRVMRELKPRLNSIGMRASKKRVLAIVKTLTERHGYARATNAEIYREVSAFVMRQEKGQKIDEKHKPIAADTTDHDLLVWIKAREVGWRRKAREQEARVLQLGAEAKSKDSAALLRLLDATSRVGVYSGRAEAYRDVWRQILFPGKSVEEGTIAPCAFEMAELEWTEKAEEQRRKTGG